MNDLSCLDMSTTFMYLHMRRCVYTFYIFAINQHYQFFCMLLRGKYSKAAISTSHKFTEGNYSRKDTLD